MKIKDIIFFSTHSNIPIFMKRLRGEGKSTLDNITVLSGFVSVLSSLRAILATNNFLNNDEELLELVYNRTHIMLFKSSTHILMAFLESSPSDEEKGLIKKLNDRFEEKYASIFKDWDNNVSIFNGFEKECEDILK